MRYRLRKLLTVLVAIMAAPVLVIPFGVYSIVMIAWSKLDDIDCERDMEAAQRRAYEAQVEWERVRSEPGMTAAQMREALRAAVESQRAERDRLIAKSLDEIVWKGELICDAGIGDENPPLTGRNDLARPF